MKQIVGLLLVLLIFPLMGQQQPANKNVVLLQELYENGTKLFVDAKKQCQTLPTRSQALLDAMVKLKKGSIEKKKKSYVQPLTNAAYLLGMLQQEIQKLCRSVSLVDDQTLKIIVTNDAPMLIAGRDKSTTREEFVNAIHTTEYSKFLFDMVTVQSFAKMHKEWGDIMARKHDKPGQIIENIAVANKALHDPLQQTINMLRYYDKQ